MHFGWLARYAQPTKTRVPERIIQGKSDGTDAKIFCATVPFSAFLPSSVTVLDKYLHAFLIQVFYLVYLLECLSGHFKFASPRDII